MSELKGACVIGQSGGPTSVINSSVLGALEAALDNPSITRVFGMAHGIKGLLNDDLYDIDKEDRDELALLRYTPSSALGSCRYKLADPDVDDTDYKRILEIFKKYDIRYFFYNGGNDSMDTCNKVSKYMMKSGYECRVMGIPKTIDNDLFGTDHCRHGLHRRDHGPSRWLAGRCCWSGYRYGRRSGSGLPAGDRLRHEEVPG